MVEELDESRAMVFLNTCGDKFRNLVFLGEKDSLGDVSGKDLDGLVRVQVVVRVYALLLVFRKVFGAHRLAEVMVERHHADEERICTNAFGNAFGEVRNLDAVVERTRCKFRNALEGRAVEVRHFHERKHGRDAEDLLDNVNQKHGCDCGKDDDVRACGNERLVECRKVESVTQEKHDAHGCGCGDNACDHAPGKLHTVAHTEERGNHGDVYNQTCKRCGEVVAVQNAVEPGRECRKCKSHAGVIEHDCNHRRKRNRVQPHEVDGVGEDTFGAAERTREIVDNPERKELQHREENKAPQLARCLEHSARRRVKAEHDEERNDDDKDEHVTIRGGEHLRVFFVLLGELECVDLFENFLGDGGTLGYDFHAARDHALDERNLVAGVELAGFSFFFEIEYVRARENVKGFVEGALQSLFGGERILQLAECFFDATLHGLNFADFERAFFVFLDERNVRLVIDDVLDLLDVVAAAEQADFGFGLGKERVRNTLLHHLVEYGHQ